MLSSQSSDQSAHEQYSLSDILGGRMSRRVAGKRVRQALPLPYAHIIDTEFSRERHRRQIDRLERLCTTQ